MTGNVVTLHQQLRNQIKGGTMTEQRSGTLENPSPELLRALRDVGLLGPSNDSGVYVTDTAVVGLAAFARGLNIVSDGVASMKLKRYKNTNGSKQEITDELMSRPNAFQTQFDWMKYMATMRVARGNAYSVIFRNKSGAAIATIPVHPSKVKPIVSDGDLFYQVNVTGMPDVVHHTDMIHWKGLCYDNVVEGISPIQAHAQTLGINLSAEKSQARSNKTNAKKFIITGDGLRGMDAGVKSSLKQDLDDVLNDRSNSFALPNNVKLDFMTMTPAELEFLDQRKYGAVDIARILGIPASMLDASEGGNKSTVEQESLNFYTLTLHPLTTQFQQELEYKLIGRPGEFYRFNFNSLMRADVSTRFDVYSKMKQMGWTDNELRTLEDWDTYDGGDRRYANLNQIPKDLEDEYYAAKIEAMRKTNMNNNPAGNNNDIQT